MTQNTSSNNVRKVYNHKQFGICITLQSQVYVAPAGLTFEFKKNNKPTVEIGTPSEGTVTDSNGNVWTLLGHNPGCGPRCTAELRQQLVIDFLTQHGNVLPAGLVQQLSVMPSGAMMRTAFVGLNDADRKICLAAAAGKLPERSNG